MGAKSSRAPGRHQSDHNAFRQFAKIFRSTSGGSATSARSNQTTCSAQRPWSGVSRCRWNKNTLSSPIDGSKTAWPVPCVEALFLPEFPITARAKNQEFVIEETVAKGAFGEVFRVKKEGDSNDYALKVLNKAQVVREDGVRQVKEEARIQQLVGHHAFIAGATALWQDRNRLYIVSEYVPGGELSALLNRCRRLPEELVRIYLAELALAIEFLHDAGIIYRDLKPENVLLTAEGNLRLVDFGLSKWLSRGTRTFTLCGTLKYMAPEVFGDSGYDHAVDWWALGVVCCRMLTDQYPIPVTVSRPSIRPENADETVSSQIDPRFASGDRSCGITSAEADASERSPPGILPPRAPLSEIARKLLLRLLDTEPRRRLKSVRELRQSAFFMGFDFDKVRNMKVTPKDLIEKSLEMDKSEDSKNESSYSDKLRNAASVFAEFESALV